MNNWMTQFIFWIYIKSCFFHWWQNLWLSVKINSHKIHWTKHQNYSTKLQNCNKIFLNHKIIRNQVLINLFGVWFVVLGFVLKQSIFLVLFSRFDRVWFICVIYILIIQPFFLVMRKVVDLVKWDMKKNIFCSSPKFNQMLNVKYEEDTIGYRWIKPENKWDFNV